MKYIKFKKIEDISCVLIGIDKLMLVSSSKISIMTLNFEDLFVLDNENYKGYNVFKDVFFIKKDFKGNKILISNVIKEFNTGKDDQRAFCGEGVYNSFFSSDLSKSYFGFYNIGKERYEWQFERKLDSIFCLKNALFIKESFLLISINTLNGKTLWQYDISKIGEFITPWEIKPAEVEQLIGVYNRILWVHLGNGKVIGLNIETGNLEHELSDTPETNIHNGILKPLADGGKRERLIHYHFDEDMGKIFGLSFNTYCEINLQCKKPQFEIWLLNDQMKSLGLKEIYRYTAKDEDGNLYFIDYNECKWGFFNTTTKSIEWVSEKITVESNPNAFTQLKEIQYGAGKVYVLDSNHTLHIFEKI